MSRIIIKNLPSYVTPARLKEHVSRKDGPGGTVTDVKVAQRPDGTSRRFAFIGFKTEAEAKKAQEWFDRTYLDTSRISVQIAEKGAKDAPAPRPNKKPRLESYQNEEQTENLAAKIVKSAASKSVDRQTSTPVKSKKDTQLEEFLHVMQPRTKKQRTWANEDSVVDSKSPPIPPLDPVMEMTPEAGASSTDIQNPIDAESENDIVEEVDDFEWMRRRMKRDLDSTVQSERVFTQDEEDQFDKSTKDTEIEKTEEQGIQPAASETILKTGRLFLRNLAFSCTESDLEKHFSSYGIISQVHIPLDPLSKQSKGLAFVTFTDPSCATQAHEELDKTSFQGRLLHILPAVDRSAVNAESEEKNSGKKTLKNERERKKKENATKEFNWSMLYMNSDAVASSIADRMNIPKADILNPDATDADSTSAAVKLALAETHIIQETKNYLEAEGIDLSVFSSLDSSDRTSRLRRSDTCILVKNIPYGTTPTQIRELFEPHGELNRVLVPPAGTIAVIEFAHSDEAAKAFRAVAYRRMGSSVIYLEKAPTGIFSNMTNRGTSEASKSSAVLSSTKNAKTVSASQGPSAEGDETDVPAGSTIFVKNLSFATTSERFNAVFRHLPEFAFARIQTKPDSKHPSVPGIPVPRLSMGFGFVGFKSPEAAKMALSSLNGFILDGHTLSAQFAGRGKEEENDASKTSSKTTKMVVKNVPFEATKKEIRELFGAHGQLKSVRLPKKFDSRSRGFAFLEFISRREAENAYVALRHTHLLGRHLVLEWADDVSQDIDLLRKKAGVGYGDGTELPGRKRKLELRDDDDAAPEE